MGYGMESSPLLSPGGVSCPAREGPETTGTLRPDRRAGRMWLTWGHYARALLTGWWLPERD